MTFLTNQRIRDFICDVLSRIIKNGSILEISSLKGEHEVVFLKNFHEIIFWQTSDPNFLDRKSIVSWIDYEKLNKKMPKPLEIDVEKVQWKLLLKLEKSLKVILNHIWQLNSAIEPFDGLGKSVKKRQVLILYVPLKLESNIQVKVIIFWKFNKNEKKSLGY